MNNQKSKHRPFKKLSENELLVHRICKKQAKYWLIVLLTVCMAGITPFSSLANAENQLAINPALSAQAGVSTSNDISSSLSSYRQDALDGRQPLVLIHGIGGTSDAKYGEWDGFLRFINTQPAFQKRFKVYLFHYDSSYSVSDLSHSLQTSLNEFIDKLDHQKSHLSSNAVPQTIKVLAYSEGGLLIRNALENKALNARVEEVITLATPFHGSPLASKAWFTSQVEKEPLFAPMRLSHKVAYWVAFKKHPNFENDFCWDNVDQSMEVRYLNSKFTKSAISVNPSVLYLPTPSPEVMPGVQALDQQYALAAKHKFITYGSFFGTHTKANQQLLTVLNRKAPLPKETPKMSMIFGKNILFSIANQTIGKLPSITKTIIGKKPTANIVSPNADNTALEDLQPHALLAMSQVKSTQAAALERDQTAEASYPFLPQVSLDALRQSQSMMPFNDGISPISSSLWLGRFTPEFEASETSPVKRLWKALHSLKGQQKARLFPGMDHRNWMEGVNRTQSAKVQDLLNPDQSARSVFEWIVTDLMS